ncbi:MAG: hypothetical protein IJV40_14810, partial [Oscillospiraceae bacterium]|nr:hypothetical protein [Oscillospiraceae bacterium]
MTRTTIKQAEAILRARRRRGAQVALFLCLAVLLTAGVFWLFHLIGIAQTYQKKVLTCTAEPQYGEGYAGFFVHTHNDDCYDENWNLVCLLPEIETHEHDESCYTSYEVLTCTIPESDGHQHTPDCYTHVTNLICTIPESDGHQHTADCYTRVRGDLDCGLEESEPELDENGNVTEPGHTHTDECYQWVDELTCGMTEGEGAHHHTDECYESHDELTCGIPEGEDAHHHTDACYETRKELICDEQEIRLHTHTDACYTTDQNGNTYLTCGEIEVVEHVHGAECFTVVELDDGVPERTGDNDISAEEPENPNAPVEEAPEEEPEALPSALPTEKPDTENTEADKTADEEPAGVSMPAQSFYGETSEVAVYVEAPEGAFPAWSYMTVAPVHDAEILDAAADAVQTEISTLCAVDICFFDSQGQEIQPLLPIRVTMTSSVVIESEDTVVVHVDGEGAASQVENTESGERDVTFEADSFSVYVLIGTTIEKNVLASDGNHYRITVTYGPESGIPESAELAVAEILADSDEYKAYMQLTDETIENEMVSFARFFDIAILAGGEEIQPAAPVEVKIELADELDDSVKTLHFGEEIEVIDAVVGTLADGDAEGTEEATAAGSEVVFSAEGFSVYGVVMTTLEKTISASDGNSYQISVTYNAAAKLPLDAELSVEEIVRPAQSDEADSKEAAVGKITDEDGVSAEIDTEPASLYDEYIAKVESVLEENQHIAFARFFNISILSDGLEIQPAGAVEVKVELADVPDSQMTAVHFLKADGDGENEIGNPSAVLLDTESGTADSFETAVVFHTDGFSVYGIVELDSAETAGSVEELDGKSYYISTDDGNNRYYYTDPLTLVSSAWKFQRTTTLDSATRFYFEAAEPDEQSNSLYIYILDEEGNKKYVNLKIETNNLRYFEFGDEEETATKYTVEIHTEGSPETFVIYHKEGAKEFYYWNRNGNYFELAKGTNTSVPKNNNTKLILTKVGSDDSTLSDPYGLDGQSLGILWNVNDTSGSAMMSTVGTANSQITPSDGSAKVTESIAVLKNKSTTVKIDPVSRADRVFVAQNSDISMWTFTCCGPAEYYITTVVNDQLKYVRFDDSQTAGTGDKGISLVDAPDDRCKITVTEGTGAYSGKYKFSSNGRVLFNNNGNFFTKADSQNDQYVYMYFAEQSNLNDDDFVVYTAKKVSVSGPVNEDGTIDYDVKDGDQVVLYTRIWNDKTLEYEYYAIDHDGMLVKAYMSGDNISWVGSKVNTMLWDFTEYHTTDADGNETNIPNYYYELQNNYSGKYIAPQVSGTDFLSDSTIGINLNGRRYNEYYSTILAWDNPYYDYAMLMVPQNEYQLGSAPIALANDSTITSDFYFAIMTNDEADGELSTVQTVDHTGYVTVKMINYPGGSQSTSNGNFHNMIQTNVLGQTSKSGSVVYSDLLEKNLSSNGYPDVAFTGYTDHNLSELYADCTYASETLVNHTFLASTYSETGYFEYDSTQNFAHLITSEEDIWFGKPMPGGGTYGVGDFVVYNQLATSSDSYQNYRNHGQFFPFNDLAKEVTVDEDGNITDFTPKYTYHNSQFNTHDIKGNPLSSLDPRYGEKLYSITNNQSIKADPYIDHYFGMEMEASFMQSASGLDDWGHDLIFEFSGDDD